ncbi:MAG: RdgB/HAM1 family non-canonical purine NTP pyrophosphatase [Anaerolineae bacterium]|jgi:XTP/dITP diphosphohydrolase|nr:RdgB/HAM1 family non-canonical purine NTP pyrophosphatase [Anaerolineae bacterium]
MHPNPTRLLIATHNQGKLREYRDLLAHRLPDIVGLAEAGITHDVDETGTTFAANALLKAQAYAALAGLPALADDSGLSVLALDGAPGVYSARYGGDGLDDAGRRAYLLAQMQAVPAAERAAFFTCVIALHDPHSGRSAIVSGRCDGHILTAERSRGHGFGYDALFVPQGLSETFAELNPTDKHRISHRGQAVAQLPALLAEVFGT